MERIRRNRLLNANDCLQNCEMKSLCSGDQLNHFECYVGLDFVFSS